MSFRGSAVMARLSCSTSPVMRLRSVTILLGVGHLLGCPPERRRAAGLMGESYANCR